MKTKNFFLTAFLFTVMLSAACCFGQSNVVFYGADTNAIGVVFVDTNLTLSAQSSIVSDLQLCLQNWGQNSKLYLRSKGESVGYLSNNKQCPHYSQNIEFPENVVSNGTNGLALQVSKKLSDAYTNAFAFAAANSNAVAAAYEFVASVSSSNFLSTVTSNTICNYLLVKNMTSQYYQKEFPGIQEGFFRYPKYTPPSLLGFYCSTNGPGTNNLYFRLPAKTNPGYGYDEWHGLPAIWHDNKWKICIGYEWVP